MHIHIRNYDKYNTYIYLYIYLYMCVYACRMPITELICKCNYISYKIAFPLHNLNKLFKLYLTYDTIL